MKHLTAFRKKFKIDRSANISDVAVAVEAIQASNDITAEFLDNIEPNSNIVGFRIRSLSNLLGRTFEHAQAMLVAMATGSPASAEALARIVVESSVSVIYLAAKGDAGTIIRFFRTWLTEHDRKLTEWKQRVRTEESNADVLAMIEERRSVVRILDDFVNQLESECEIDASTPLSEWPRSLFHRFQAIGRETDYYESYHRLSGSSHMTGEDTLMWLFAMQLPDVASRRKLGEEAWAYSIMMTYIASLFFIDAGLTCCLAYGRDPSADIEAYRISLHRAVEGIASRAGVPLDAGTR